MLVSAVLLFVTRDLMMKVQEMSTPQCLKRELVLYLTVQTDLHTSPNVLMACWSIWTRRSMVVMQFSPEIKSSTKDYNCVWEREELEAEWWMMASQVLSGVTSIKPTNCIMLFFLKIVPWKVVFNCGVAKDSGQQDLYLMKQWSLKDKQQQDATEEQWYLFSSNNIFQLHDNSNKFLFSTYNRPLELCLLKKMVWQSKFIFIKLNE